jgi:hypothetical protein
MNARLERRAARMREQAGRQRLLFAEDYLRKVEPPPSVLELIFQVAKKHDVPGYLITQPCRFTEVSAARGEIAYRLREKGLSFPLIGRYLRLHHTSVIYLCRRFAARQLSEFRKSEEGGTTTLHGGRWGRPAEDAPESPKDA